MFPNIHSAPQGLLALEADTHYNDVIIGAMASQITSPTTVYSTAYSDADQRKHQSSTSLTSEFPVRMASNAEMYPFDGVIMTHT